jgi:hypothetical protein
MITRRLEAALTKRRILEIYLNVIEWGDGIFGAEAAARAYFGKPASALTPDEAALLAGAIINPREHSPANPTKRLLRRQQIIVRRMGIKPEPPAPAGVDGTAVSVTTPTVSADEPSAPVVDPILGMPLNTSPPALPGPVQSLKPIPGNGGPPPINPSIPKVSARKIAAPVASLPPRFKGANGTEQLVESVAAERH